MSNIFPVGKRVLVKPRPKEDTTKSGIIIPDDAMNPPFFVGEVIAITKEVSLVTVGQTIAHKKYGMEIVPTEKGDLYLVDETSIIAIYEED